jgi:hypothetical protein
MREGILEQFVGVQISKKFPAHTESESYFIPTSIYISSKIKVVRKKHAEYFTFVMCNHEKRYIAVLE